METQVDIARKKILNTIDLQRMLTIWRFKNHQVVFTNGCFDILHRGHVEYLSQAATFGDKLIVGMNSDHSVRQLKGPDRPVQDEDTRALILAMLPMVQAVILFDEETPHNLIDQVKPDVLVKGGDYKAEEIVGADLVKASGGQVVIIPFVEGHSTSEIIDRLKK